MKGIIKTYLPEKKYGFIKGDDGKNYFFHENEFKKIASQCLCEDMYVSFDQKANPKGYKALNCSIIDPAEILTYILPEKFITSKSTEIRGWEVMEKGNWVIHGSSAQSPEIAKRNIITRAKFLGANALLNFTYYKTEGSSGNYYYTIHNYAGRIISIAKKSPKGSCSISDFNGMNEKAELTEKQFIVQTKRAKKIRILILSISFLALTLIVKGVIFWALSLLILSFIFSNAITSEYWLKRIKKT